MPGWPGGVEHADPVAEKLVEVTVPAEDEAAPGLDVPGVGGDDVVCLLIADLGPGQADGIEAALDVRQPPDWQRGLLGAVGLVAGVNGLAGGGALLPVEVTSTSGSPGMFSRMALRSSAKNMKIPVRSVLRSRLEADAGVPVAAIQLRLWPSTGKRSVGHVGLRQQYARWAAGQAGWAGDPGGRDKRSVTRSSMAPGWPMSSGGTLSWLG